MNQAGWQVAEYDHKKPVAIIEYKDRRAQLNVYDSNNTTLRRLADRAGLPFFIVVYYKEKLRFAVIPMNEPAQVFLPETTTLSEEQYVELLYRLRGRQVPEDVRREIQELQQRKEGEE